MITNYVVAKRETSKTSWNTVTSSISRTTYTVQGLLEKAEYEFKVCAENIYGTGEPSIGAPIVAKNPFDPPDAPKACKVKEVSKSGVKLEWEKPNKDGGKPIKGTNFMQIIVFEATLDKISKN